jgi:hypothetical protein
LTQLPLVNAVLRWRYAFIGLIAIFMLVGASMAVSPDSDWQFFSWGGRLLFGEHRLFLRSDFRVDPSRPGGLHLYANYPFLQIGPPPLVVARVLAVAADHGLLLAGVVIQLLGIAFVLAVDRAFTAPTERRLRTLIGGTLVTIVWGALTLFRHLDDAMTLAALGVATWAMRTNRIAVAGILLGLAAASKPWGIPLLALSLAPSGWPSRVRCAVASIATAGSCWLPFIIADRKTLHLGQVSLYQSNESALAALRFGTLLSAQSMRLMQLGGGILLAVILVLAGRWSLAPLAAFAGRLAIDPSAYQYYGCGVVAAAFLADVRSRRGRLPWFTLVATAGWIASQASTGTTASYINLTTYAGLLLAALICAVTRPRDDVPAPVTATTALFPS